MIKKVLTSEKIPIKLWLNNIEKGALEQVKNVANLPFAFKHLAVMPDCHQGYGMPIGGVLATKGVIVPNAVGVDIGCGICVCKTNLTLKTLNLSKVVSLIKEEIPVGFLSNKKRVDESLMPDMTNIHKQDYLSTVQEHYSKALYQLGSLGGGNHFIEIQKDNNDFVWIMVHSGSRNLGKRVADFYNKLATKLNQKWYSEVPKNWELAFFPIENREAKRYIAEMNYCIDFALANRKLMLNKVKKILSDNTIIFKNNNQCEDVKYEKTIDIAHNYAKWEHHFKTNVIIHRKGATSAKKGEIGIIPGSQGTKSYIVEGLGNPESFMSCSHGAGRKLGRNQAIKELNLQDELNHMKGIIHNINSKGDLDEAPGAYKNIDEVMENQKDLVKIVTELFPVAVIKG